MSAALHAISRPNEPGVRLDHDTPELAATYDRVGHRQFEHGKHLIALLALQSGQRVLDVGCGTGLLGAWVAEQVAPQGQVIGLDPLPLRVALAGRKHPAFSTRVGRAEDLSDFENASFDAVYLNSVFHWVPDQPRALKEALRVLRPGGRLAVNSADAARPHQSNALVREILDAFKVPHTGAGSGGLNHPVDGPQLAQLLQDAGFAQVTVTPHTFVDHLDDVDELIAWSSSSSFGNWLADLDPSLRDQVRAELALRLDALRVDAPTTSTPSTTARPIALRRNLVFAVGTRP